MPDIKRIFTDLVVDPCGFHKHFIMITSGTADSLIRFLYGRNKWRIVISFSSRKLVAIILLLAAPPTKFKLRSLLKHAKDRIKDFEIEGTNCNFFVIFHLIVVGIFSKNQMET